MIPVEEYTPDQPVFNNVGASEAKNVIPALKSYRPFRNFVGIGNAYSGGDIRGAVSIKYSDFEVEHFAGTSVPNLRRFDGSAWEDVSRAAGYNYNGNSQLDGMFWRFAQFDLRVIAVNGVDEPQVFFVNSSSDFADLAGSPPVGSRDVTVVRDTVVMGGYTSDPNAVSWCNTGDPTAWASGSADSQTFPDGGRLMRLAGGPTLRVFMENAIYLGSPTIAPLTFTFDKVSQNLGILAEGSLASYQNLDFFVSSAGIKMLVNGTEIIPIGAEKVDRYFFSSLGVSQNFNDVWGAIDPVNKLYVLGFHWAGDDEVDDGIAEAPITTLLLYNWEIQRWSRAVVDLDYVFTSFDTPGINSVLAGFNDSHVFGYFNGDNLAATVTTGEAELTPGRKSFVTGVRPMCDGGSPTVTLITRDRPFDTATTGSAVSAHSATGVCHFRSEARYHRAQIDIPAASTWSHIYGVDPEFRPAGYR